MNPKGGDHVKIQDVSLELAKVGELCGGEQEEGTSLVKKKKKRGGG